MKHWSAIAVIVLAVLSFASIASASSITWTNPTTYTDSTPVSPANLATLTTKIYHATTSAGCATGALFATVLNGATSWTGTLPVTTRGSTTYYCATSTIPSEGQESAKSPAVSYTVPFGNLNNPVINLIQ